MTMLDPHLDSYQLSSAVDGEGDGLVADHLEACSACREEIASWKRRLGMLAAPVVSGSGDEAITAALDAWEPATAPEPLRRRPRPSGAPARVVKVAAAVVVVAAVASGLLVGLRHHPSGTVAASHSAASPAARVPVAAPANGMSTFAGSPTGKLGSVSSTAALVGDLRSRVRSKATAPVPSTARCLASAERLDGSPAARPTFEASVRFEGHAGEVFVFPDTGRYVAWVLATDCSSLANVGFP